MNKFKPKKAAKPKTKKKPKGGGSNGKKSNAWRAYVGGRSNEPIPW